MMVPVCFGCGRGKRKGFTLVEVVIAAGLLGLFTVAAARPLQQGVISSALSADRAAAVHYAVSGVEWARARRYSELAGFGGTHTWKDEARGITYKRTASKVAKAAMSGSDVLWLVTSEVKPVLTAYLPSEVRRLPTMLRPVKIVTYHAKWLSWQDSGN
jgi:prepilin-type N-terminal cleavage/methylation domain-containing protein